MSYSVNIRYHQIIADYFTVKPLYLDEPSNRKPDVRKLSELPYHLIRGEMWNALNQTMTDLSFIEAKCAAGMVFKLISDYIDTFNILPDVLDEKKLSAEHEDRIKKYIKDLVTYSENEKVHPEIIPSIELITGQNNEPGDSGINAGKRKLNHLKACFGFINSQTHLLAEFGSVPGFCLQQACNYMKSGPVDEEAAEIIQKDSKNVYLLKPPGQRIPFKPFPSILKTIEGATCVSITPDGKKAISGRGSKWSSSVIGNDLKLWDLKTGQLIKDLSGHTERVWDDKKGRPGDVAVAHSDSIWAVKITPDGKRALSGSNDRTLRLWDLDNGQCLKTFKNKGSVRNLSISPNGKMASSVSGKSINVWDIEKGSLLKRLEGHTSNVTDVCLTSDCKKIISVSEDRTLRIWEIDSGKCLKILQGHSGYVNCVSVTPDGKRVVTGGQDKTVRVWNLETNVCIGVFEGHTAYVLSVDITPDGKLVVSGGSDGTVCIWAVGRKECSEIFNGHNNQINSVAFTADGYYAVSAGFDYKIRVWQVGSGGYQEAEQAHKDRVNEIQLTTDGKHALSASDDKTLKVWDMASGICQRVLEGHSYSVNCVSISLDQKFTVSGSGRFNKMAKAIRVWDHDNGKTIKTLDVRSAVNAIRITPDGQRIVAVTRVDTLEFWDNQAESCLKVFPNVEGSESPSLCLSPDGKNAFVIFDLDDLGVIDLETGKCRKTAQSHPNVIWSMDLSPDGKLAVTGCGGNNYNIHVWNLIHLKCIRKLKGIEGSLSVNCISVTPDGRRALSGSEDKTLCLWDIRSGECLHVMRTDSNLFRVAVAPDGQRAVSASWDKTIRVWDLTNGECLAVFPVETKAHSLSQITASGHFACGSHDGKVNLFKARNLVTGPPLVTYSRVWIYGEHGKEGHWDEELKTICPWCGHQFPITRKNLDIIESIAGTVHLSPGESPCLKLPDEAWDELQLFFNCPFCSKPLRSNPFVVDNKEI